MNGMHAGVLICALVLASGGTAWAQDPPAATQSLRVGAEGEEVRRVQIRLNRLGYAVAADGEFGPRTEAAVKAFQRDQGLAVDGVVGPRTRQALDAPSSGGVVAALGGQVDRSKPRAWARAARASGRKTLVVAFEGWISYSTGYTNQIYRYQDRLRSGRPATRPLPLPFSSYVGRHLLVPALSSARGGPDLAVYPETSEFRRDSPALAMVLAWHQEFGADLNLVVVGHSFGGHAALRLTRKLGLRGIQVDHLLTIDPRSRNQYDEFVKPPNVTKHRNYYQRGPIFPGYPMQGATNQRIRGVSHFHMPGASVVRERFRRMTRTN